MKVIQTVLTGPVLAFANSVQRVLDLLVSVPLSEVGTRADLPNAAKNNRRQIIVRDIDGAGTWGIATASGGVWKSYAGVTIA